MNKRVLCVMLLAAVVVGGCFGPAARDEALLPAVDGQWQVLRENTLADVSAMDAAVKTGVGLPLAWQEAKPLVLAGIDELEATGNISPLFANSKREGVRVMDEMVSKCRM